MLPIATSVFARVSGVLDDATCWPVEVRARALMTHWPFLKAVAPVVELNAAVLKLSVTGAAAASAAIDVAADDRFCEATTVSLVAGKFAAALQFIRRSTPASFCVPGSTFNVTSS